MNVSKALRISTAMGIVQVGFAVLLAVYFCSAALMKTQWFHHWVERRVIADLEHVTGARVAIGDLEIHPAIFQINLRDVTLRGREGALEPPLLAAHTVVVRLNPASLVLRRLWLSSFYADGVAIHWVTYPDGSTNLPGAIATGAGPPSRLMRLSITALDLEDADLYWNNHKVPLDLRAHGIALLLYFSRLRGYWGSCSASPLEFRGRGRWSPGITFGVHIRLTQRGATLSNLAWRTAGAEGQGIAQIVWTPRLAATATLQGRGNLREIAHIIGWKPVERGQLQGTSRVIYREGKLSARGRLEARDVTLRTDGFMADRINLASGFSANGEIILLPDLKISALGGSVSGQADIRLRNPTPQFSFDLRLLGIDMDRALRTVSSGATVARLLSSDSSIDGTARVNWAGNLQHVQSFFDLKLSTPHSLPAGMRPLTGTLQGTAQLSPPFSSHIDSAQLQTPHSWLLAQGVLGVVNSRLQLTYSTTDFTEGEPLIGYITALTTPIGLQLRSSLVFAGAMTGSALSPDLRGRIRAGDFNYRGWSWNGLSASLDASASHLKVAAGRLHSGRSAFTFAGSLGLTNWNVKPNSPVSFTTEARRSPLRGLEDALDVRYPLTGLVTGRLNLDGTVSSLTGKGNFEVVDGTVSGEPFDVVSAQPLAVGSVWDFQNIFFRKGTGTASGWLHLDWPRRRFSTNLHGDSFSLSQFDRIQRRQAGSATSPRAAWIAGRADFQLHGQGSFAEPSGEMTLGIHNIELRGSKAGDFEVRLGLGRKRLQARGRLNGRDDELVDFALDTATGATWPAKLQSHFTNFHLQPWMRWLGAEYSQIPMVLSGSLAGDGPLRHPRNFRIGAQAQSFTVAVPGFVLKSAQPVEIHYAGGTLHSNPFRMRGPSTDVSIQVSANLLPRPVFSVALHGSARASVLKLFNPSIEAAGGFGLNVSIVGSMAQPALAGEIDVRNVSIRYEKMPLILAGLNGRIGLRGNQVTVISLSGTSGESGIQLSGTATIGSPVIYDIHAHLQRVRFEYPAEFTSLLNGNLHLTGSSQSGELSGDIAVQQMFVGERFNVVDWMGQLGSALGEIPTGETAGSPSRTRLDLRITSNPEIRLASRTLSFVATIDANLRGTVARPVATGDIRIQEGNALIAGNQYQILRGEIQMTSPLQTVPVLDIEAQTRVDRYTVTLDVAGPADRAKVAYRSDPPLPTEDILSLLALGYAPQQQLMTSTGREPTGTLGASALLSQALSSPVSSRVQQIFGVSRIRIDPNLIGPTSAGGARVTVEEQLAHNFTITYSTNTAAAQQRDIRVRWDLSNRISLIGEQDINGVYGFEIRFRRQLK
jgi:translocation and assembly module TamB